jgi:hypothetical protein
MDEEPAERAEVQMGDMEMEITGTDIEIPNNLIVGDSLPNASVSMSMSVV